MSKDKLVKQIMKQAKADGEPVTEAEALEMAEMELKASANSVRTVSEEPKPRKKREVKLDPEKVEIIKKIYDFLLTSGEESATIVNEQREIDFRNYTITLIKHRPKKED